MNMEVLTNPHEAIEQLPTEIRSAVLALREESADAPNALDRWKTLTIEYVSAVAEVLDRDMSLEIPADWEALGVFYDQLAQLLMSRIKDRATVDSLVFSVREFINNEFEHALQLGDPEEQRKNHRESAIITVRANRNGDDVDFSVAIEALGSVPSAADLEPFFAVREETHDDGTSDLICEPRADAPNAYDRAMAKARAQLLEQRGSEPASEQDRQDFDEAVDTLGLQLMMEESGGNGFTIIRGQLTEDGHTGKVVYSTPKESGKPHVARYLEQLKAA